MDGDDGRGGGSFQQHHRQHNDENYQHRFSGHQNHQQHYNGNMHATDNYPDHGPPYANTGAVGTHTSGGIAGPSRQYTMHHGERLPTALDRIFALQKVRLTELGFSDNFDRAATSSTITTDSAYLSSDDSTKIISDSAGDAKTESNLDPAEIARRKKKNQQKKEKQKQKKKQQREQKPPETTSSAEQDQTSALTETVEIEYVPEEITFDADDSSTSQIAKEFSRVFTAFQQLSAGRGADDDENANNNADKNADSTPNVKLTKVPVDLHEADDEDEHATTKKSTDAADGAEKEPLSRRKLKKLLRPSVAKLKQQVERPDVVEFHDVTSPDPKLLIFLKASRGTVPVPRHWCFKRKYLAGKRGIEKPPFELPDFIRKTGITEMREARAEKDSGKTLKQQMREKVRPKMGKIDINYQKLHDAFFKWQTKPRMSIHGDLYYEGKETEAKMRDKKPGVISNDLRLALGMPVGPTATKYPPPWLIAMQRYGPPPSYPELRIPGLNAPIPDGCTFGYHAGGWGKPPVDERGRPLYGDVFGMANGGAAAAVVEKPDEYESGTTKLWGELQYDDDDEESSEAESDMDETDDAAGAAAGDEAKKAAAAGDGADTDGTAAAGAAASNAAGGLVTPMSSGTQSSVLAGGLETPAEIELRKQRIATEMDAGDDQRPLYTVLPEKRVDKLGNANMMASMHLYDLRGAPSKGGVGDVTLAIDPAELEQRGALPRADDVEKRYQAQLDQQRHQLEKEDFSDMVAEHAQRQAQKRKKQQQDSSRTTTATKKSKDFKF